MRKFLFLAVLTGWTVVAGAQEVVPEKKHSVATNGFWSNWFVGAQSTWNAFYQPTGKAHTRMGGALQVGKWFTPELGLRTTMDFGPAGERHDDAFDGTMWCWTLNEHVLLNVTNLLAGYNEQRLWNVIPYVGAGVAHNTSCHRYTTDLSLGVLNTLRVNRRLAVSIEVGWNNYAAHFLTPSDAAPSGLGNHHRAHQLTVAAGVTWHLGRTTWQRTPDVESMRELSQDEIDALNAQLQDLQQENIRLQQENEQLRSSQPQQ